MLVLRREEQTPGYFLSAPTSAALAGHIEGVFARSHRGYCRNNMNHLTPNCP